MRRTASAVGMFGGVLVWAGAAWALINPNFTPRNLVEQANTILVLKVGGAGGRGRVVTEVTRCLKGKEPAKAPVLDLTADGMKEQAAEIEKQLRAMGPRPVVLVSGKNEKGEPASYLHVTAEGDLGKWYTLTPGAEGVWAFRGLDSDMQAVWSGASDMFVRIAEMLIKNPDLAVPVAAGVDWAAKGEKIGAVPGKVRGTAAVDLAGDGRLALFAASGEGDRVFRHNAKTKAFEDATGTLKLGSRSLAWTWGDLDADGRTDLASWDGKELKLWMQQTGGAFSAQPVKEVPEGGCLDLALLGSVKARRPGLVWTGPAGPVLLAWQDDALTVRKAFDCGGADLKKLGAPAGALAADFDGDSWPDVLWPLASGSIFFKGRADGGFEKGATCKLATGGERPTMALGDFDGDGLLDVLAVSETSCCMWQNRGGGAFEETLVQCGEIEHIFAGKAVAGAVCDFNQDGLQDVFFAYREAAPQLFFNRGFRSFGHALNLEAGRRLPDAEGGSQSGLVADLDGDGGQDLAVVQKNGEVWVLRQDVNLEPLGVAATLPAGAFPGPVTVSASDGRRALGSWNVTAGGAPAFFFRADAGELILKWRLPGGAAREKKAEVEKGVVRVSLGDK